MKENNLFDLMQNTALSAIALHSFSLGFYNIAKNRKVDIIFPRIEYMFFVLPIVYNYNSMEIIKSSNELYTALIKDSSIILGLQERSNKMSKQTFSGLNLAFNKKILTYNDSNKTIEILKGFQSKKIILPIIMNDSVNSVKKIQDSAFKLGSIFAKRNPQNLQFELNIRF